MPISRDCAIELCKTLAASVLWGGTTLVNAANPIAYVEATLGAAALFASLGHEHARKIDSIVKQMARRVERESDTWIMARGPGARGKREEALLKVQQVILSFEPTVKDLVALGLNRDRIVAFYLDRTAERDEAFADKPENDIARELLGDVVGYTFDIVRNAPEMQSHALEALLGHSERVERKIDALPDAIVEQLFSRLPPEIVRGAEQRGLERATIIALARRLKPNEVQDFDQAVKELENAVNIALEAIARGERGTNIDAFVDAVLKRIAKETRAGAFDKAASEVDAGLAGLAVREAEQQEGLKRARIALTEAGIEQEILRRDAPAAARRIESLIALRTDRCPVSLTPEFRERYDFYCEEEGERRGIVFSLEIAVALASLTVRDAGTPDEKGSAHYLLGNALRTLGERKGDDALLEEAVAAFREALKEWTRERVPLQWAMTQNSLGNALWTLGKRKGDTTLLYEAASAYREALTERRRERVPLDWARTQNNLGNALSALGERKGDDALLVDAVAAYREALTEQTRERVPLDWATTQNNLGATLSTLGERKGDEALLEDAVSAFSEALKERTRERVPLQWAGTQYNLGNALRILGRRKGDEALLEDAVSAFSEALKEQTRERTPYYWKETMQNLACAEALLAELQAKGP